MKQAQWGLQGVLEPRAGCRRRAAAPSRQGATKRGEKAGKGSLGNFAGAAGTSCLPNESSPFTLCALLKHGQSQPPIPCIADANVYVLRK